MCVHVFYHALYEHVYYFLCILFAHEHSCDRSFVTGKCDVIMTTDTGYKVYEHSVFCLVSRFGLAVRR